MSAHQGYEADVAVAMPADVNQPDRIVAGLTGRQTAIVATAAAVLWIVYLTTARVVPLLVFACVAIPVMAAAVVLAVGRRDGVSLDRWLLTAIRHAVGPRRYVPATASAASATDRGAPAELASVVSRIGEDGVLHLSSGAQVLLLACEPVNFSLRSAGEQRALVAALARCLHAAATPMQILVRCVPVDLGGVAVRLRETAPQLPHPALETAAVEHARFVEELAASREVLHREVIVAVADTSGQVSRRAAETAAALAAAQVRAVPLDGTRAAAVLAACADPYAPATDGVGFGGVVAGPTDQLSWAGEP